MITLNQLSYSLLEQVRGGLLSDDEAINLRLVRWWVHNVRAMLIRQDIDKGRSISNNILQELACIDVAVVEAHTCPCPVTWDCTIVRTVRKIPKPIETAQKDLIIKVSPIGVTSRPFTIINQFRATWAGNNRFSRLSPKAFYRDGYIWIINAPQGIKKITIQGVFENPEELAGYVNCSAQPCFTLDDSYPVSNWMIPAIEKIIKETNLNQASMSPTDSAGNAKADYNLEQRKE